MKRVSVAGLNLADGDRVTVDAKLDLLNSSGEHRTLVAIDWRPVFAEEHEPTGEERDDLLAVVQTREEWDTSVCGARYADGWGSPTRLRDIVKPGLEQRRAAARAEFERTVPTLTDEIRAWVREQAAELVALRNSGGDVGDHLGCPGRDHPGGYSVSCTPNLATGGAGLQFRYTRSPYFDGKEFPLPEEERQWFIDLARELTGCDTGDVWNTSGSYVNVQWWPAMPNRSNAS